MLKVTIQHGHDQVVLKVEGNLSGPSIAELEHCWSSLVELITPQQVIADLGGLTFVSIQGKSLLAKMCRMGARFVGSGPMTRALVEQITAPDYPASIEM